MDTEMETHETRAVVSQADDRLSLDHGSVQVKTSRDCETGLDTATRATDSYGEASDGDLHHDRCVLGPPMSGRNKQWCALQTADRVALRQPYALQEPPW